MEVVILKERKDKGVLGVLLGKEGKYYKVLIKGKPKKVKRESFHPLIPNPPLELSKKDKEDLKFCKEFLAKVLIGLWGLRSVD